MNHKGKVLRLGFILLSMVSCSLFSVPGAHAQGQSLSYSELTAFDTPVSFEGEFFNANEPLDAGYRFNSWRIGVNARALDGGADIDELFNFATFTSASVSVSRSL